MKLTKNKVIEKYEERLDRAAKEGLEGTYAETLLTLDKLRKL